MMVMTLETLTSMINKETEIFRRHGADAEMARSLSELFRPVAGTAWAVGNEVRGSAPAQRYHDAQTGLDYRFLAFEHLLAGRTDYAHDELTRAAALDQRLAYGDIISKLDEVQQVVRDARHELDEARRQYGNGSLREYLMPPDTERRAA